MPKLPPSLSGLSILLIVAAAGCQSGQQVSSHRLIEHQALIDFSGLGEPQIAEAVRVQVSLPQTWLLHDVENKPLYNHQQWKSASAKTAVGVIYARLPLPLSANTILWMATKQYTARGDDGKELGRWDDELGRKWFEAETSKYHARGYVIVNGLDAWIVYSGFKTDVPPEPGEISAAARCMQTFVPIGKGEKMPATTGGTATETDSATKPAAAE